MAAGMHDTTDLEQPCWYALHTRAKHEKFIGDQLLQKGVHTFVPTVQQIHRWSDRSRAVDVPLFSCYVFVHDVFSRAHVPVMRTPGVFRWIGPNGRPAAIPDSQMDAVRSLIEKNVPVSPHAFLEVGQRVRIRGGSLDGLEGILIEKKSEHRLIISVDLIQQSLAITVDGYELERVQPET